MASRWRNIEAVARGRVPTLLADALGVPPAQVRVTPAKNEAYDLAGSVGGRSVLIEVLGAPSGPALLAHWERVKRAAKKAGVPVIVVPWMPEPARAFCLEREINWMDLSGNAHVQAPGLHVRIGGHPNLYARAGRPASVFERRGSRLSRILLLNPDRDWSVRECAAASGLNEGHVSRIVSRLLKDQLLTRDGRRLRVRDRGLLLDAWRAAANFSRHRVLKGHVPARSGEELLRLVSTRLTQARLEHAATGLGAAWLSDSFAAFRLATFFVREWPTPAQLEGLHFREEAEGANVWLVLPNDDGVFDGSRLVDGVPCVHPVQAWVDLKDHPERAAEAAEHLRPSLLGVAGGA